MEFLVIGFVIITSFHSGKDNRVGRVVASWTQYCLMYPLLPYKRLSKGFNNKL